MELRPLGGTGVQVSAWTLGAMMFGSLGNPDRDECVRMVHEALDAGINTVDTADIYSAGGSEEIVGEALAGRRDRVVLATKCFWPMGADPNDRGASRRWVTTAVEASLRRLRTDRIDVFFLHKPDHATDLEESLGALTTLVHQGKVLLAGTSSFPAERLVEARWVAERRGLVRPRVEQPAYSLLTRGAEADVLPACQRAGMGVMAAAPLTGGWLTGKYRHDRPHDADSRAARWGDERAFGSGRPGVRRKYELVEVLAALADEVGHPLTHLAMAFAVEHPAVSTAIIGPRTLDQLRQVLPAADLRLGPDVLDRIDAIVPPGRDVDPRDRWYEAPALDPAARRRPRHTSR